MPKVRNVVNVSCVLIGYFDNLFLIWEAVVRWLPLVRCKVQSDLMMLALLRMLFFIWKLFQAGCQKFSLHLKTNFGPLVVTIGGIGFWILAFCRMF